MSTPHDLQVPVDTALRQADDAAAALIWRRTCRELSSGARVGVGALSAGLAARTVERLQGRAGGLGRVALGYDPGDDEGATPPMLRDAFLGVHGVVWATPAAQPLGARERAAVGRIIEATGASRGLILVVDTHVLERMSDDPAAELASVVERVRQQAPEGWQVATDESPELTAFLAAIRTDVEALTLSRHRAVAARLLDDARDGLSAMVVREADAMSRHEAAVASEDEALERARKAGERAASHTLGVLRRRTEELRLDLRAFLRELEEDVGPQVEGTPDVESARRALPHWLEHVVQAWLRDRLGAWRAQVHDDLRHVTLADEALAHAELILPALHPAPVPSQGRWRRALGLSAGIGGAAVLAAFQLWIPALLLAGGGVAWSVLDRDSETLRRDQLIERGRDAVRQLGLDADRVLGDQLQRFEDQLATLGEARAARLETERASARAQLDARVRLHAARLEDARQALERFAEHVADLELEDAG